jgi:hypothetical protein
MQEITNLHVVLQKFWGDINEIKLTNSEPNTLSYMKDDVVLFSFETNINNITPHIDCPDIHNFSNFTYDRMKMLLETNITSPVYQEHIIGFNGLEKCLKNILKMDSELNLSITQLQYIIHQAVENVFRLDLISPMTTMCRYFEFVEQILIKNTNDMFAIK